MFRLTVDPSHMLHVSNSSTRSCRDLRVLDARLYEYSVIHWLSISTSSAADRFLSKCSVLQASVFSLIDIFEGVCYLGHLTTSNRGIGPATLRSFSATDMRSSCSVYHERLRSSWTRIDFLSGAPCPAQKARKHFRRKHLASPTVSCLPGVTWRKNSVRTKIVR